MARIYGLNGTLRGRQGNNVFSVQNGTQVVKAYQPVVSNPRSTPQMIQRAKFALAGKMSGITPSDALVGLPASSPRQRRALFVSSLARIASTTQEGGTIVATIPYDQVVYSKGSLSIYSNPAAITAVWGGQDNNSRVGVTIPRLDTANIFPPAPTGYGELAVVALYDAASSMLDEVQVVERSATTAINVRFRQGARRDVRVAVYYVPFMVDTRIAAQRAGNIQDAESDISLSSSLSSRLAGATFGLSIFQGVIGVIGSQQSNAPAPNDDMRGIVEEGLMETAVAPAVEGGKKKK